MGYPLETNEDFLNSMMPETRDLFFNKITKPRTEGGLGLFRDHVYGMGTVIYDRAKEPVPQKIVPMEDLDYHIEHKPSPPLYIVHSCNNNYELWIAENSRLVFRFLGNSYHISVIVKFKNGKLSDAPFQIIVDNPYDSKPYFQWNSATDIAMTLRAVLGVRSAKLLDILDHFTVSHTEAVRPRLYHIDITDYKDEDGRILGRREVRVNTRKKAPEFRNHFLEVDMEKIDSIPLEIPKDQKRPKPISEDVRARLHELFPEKKKYAPKRERFKPVSDIELEEYPENLRKYAKLINDENYHVSPIVLARVIKELSLWLESKNKKNSTACLPNFAFLGEPGIGKTELAKKLMRILSGNIDTGETKFLSTTGTRLKGAYKGHTRYTVVSFLEENFKNLLPEVPKVLFIDEAYVLLSDAADSFSQESVEVLLKLAENIPDRTVEAPNIYHSAWEDDTPKNISVTLDRNSAIWLAGYEKEMRKALSVNPGFYRRFKIINLPSPPVEELIIHFHICLKKKTVSSNPDLWKKVVEQFFSPNSIQNPLLTQVEEYFQWGKSKTYAEFFANFAGVEKLADEIGKFVLLEKQLLTKSDLTEIINEQKSEIRRQYKTVIERAHKRLPFEVHTEIHENFTNYIGAKAAVKKMQNIIDMICMPENYKKCDRPKGALLVGPPGTGKTHLARCMAGQLMEQIRLESKHQDVAFFSVSSTELTSPELVKVLFSEAASYDSAVIFIDEIDAIGSKRGDPTIYPILIQLMNELDGFDNRNNIFVLAATNAPERLDAALVRPGRLDLRLSITNPDEATRYQLIQFYTANMEYSDDVRKTLAKYFNGCSQVEIKSILNDARILYFDCLRLLPEMDKYANIEPWFLHRVLPSPDSPIPNGAYPLTISGKTVVCAQKDVFCSELFLKDAIEIFSQRKYGFRNHEDLEKELTFSIERNDDGRSSSAIHEVGHALVRILRNKTFEKITILSRGNALGFVEPSPTEQLITKQDYQDRIDSALGGKVAEELIYGPDNVSSGAGRDLIIASTLAKKMFMQLGMSANIGPIAFYISEDNYLNTDNTKTIFSGKLAEEAEYEVRQFLLTRYEEVKKLLADHKDELIYLAGEIFQKEEISGEEFRILYEDKLAEKKKK